MVLYNVTGMSCAACSARIEKAVSAVKGVKQCSVNLLTNSMSVEGGESADIINAVEKAGYGAALKDKPAAKAADDSSLEDKESPKIKRRLFWSLGFMIVLLYISMGGMMWGAPLPPFLADDSSAFAFWHYNGHKPKVFCQRL